GGDVTKLSTLSSNPSRSVRIAAVLALRRLRSPEIKVFLNDQDEYIVAEAARAINDDLSIPEALPALAKLVEQTKFKSEPLLRRAINACLRVGDDASLNMLIQMAQRKDLSPPIQAEAMATIGSWASPSETDRVDGRYRGVVTRDASNVVTKVKPMLVNFISSKEPAVMISLAKLLGELKMTDQSSVLINMFKNDSVDVRIAALNALNQLKDPQLARVVDQGMHDKHTRMRAAALGLLDKVELSKESLTGIVNDFMKKGSPNEQQRLISALGKLPSAKTEAVLSKLLDDMKAKKLPANIMLDVTETIEKSDNNLLKEKLKASQTYHNSMEEYASALQGGNIREGYRFFTENLTAQCIKCHALRGSGSNVGPDLTHIGSTLTREQILQAMVQPSERLAPGYGVVSLTLKDGSEVFGKLDKETEKELTLITANAEPLRIPVDRIATRKNIPSSMPDMTKKMTKHEMRDVVEFLAAMK
ncbi:MAG: HEAT repeat domain-containing protein, partial [Saprospiraceae bacterium]